MFRVVVKDKAYNSMGFRFDSMECVSIFVETVLRSTESEVEVTIELVKVVDANDL